MTLTIVLAILGGCAGLLALAKLIRGGWRVTRRVVHTVDMVPRMAALTEELSPNSGHSIKDKVNEAAAASVRTERKVDDVGRRLDEHIRNHPGG